MRTVSIQEFEQHPADFISEVEAGGQLTLIRGGKAVATVAPATTSTGRVWQSEEQRQAAVEEFLEQLRRGYDLGGFKITDRDALYDRD